MAGMIFDHISLSMPAILTKGRNVTQLITLKIITFSPLLATGVAPPERAQASVGGAELSKLIKFWRL